MAPLQDGLEAFMHVAEGHIPPEIRFYCNIETFLEFAPYKE
jgi:hypothetical protein